MDQKERFLKALNKKLNANQKQLLSLINIESRKESLVFRMPLDVISLESVWEKIIEIGKDLKVSVSKAEVYATLGDLDEILGEIEWLWKGWIPKGFVTMVVGDPGVGKSALIQHLVKIITEGSCFPLEPEPLGKEGNAIWIDTEASQQILKVRARTMKMNKRKVFIPIVNGDLLSQANLGSDEDKATIIDLIEGVEPAILVLDSLGGSHSKGENKVEDIRPVLEFLALLARDKQIAILVIHHLNKSKEGESPEVSLYRIRGSTVIPAYCRSIFAIEAVNKKLKIRLIKSNLARTGHPISVIPLLDTDGEFTGFDYEEYIPPPEKKNKKQVCSEWIMEMLLKSKGTIPLAKLTEAGQGLGYSRQNLYAAKDVLGDKIIVTGTGREAFWNLVQEDKKVMKEIMKNGKSKPRK